MQARRSRAGGASGLIRVAVAREGDPWGGEPGLAGFLAGSAIRMRITY